MAKVNAYMTFNGNCEEAFNFYKSVFGGEFGYIGRYKDMPEMDGQKTSAEEGEKIMHVCLQLSKETSLMGSDSSNAFGHATIIGNNISLSVNAENKEEADRIFNALSAGGNITMPMNDTFWGAYFGMLVDKFGINWMMNFDANPQK